MLFCIVSSSFILCSFSFSHRCSHLLKNSFIAWGTRDCLALIIEDTPEKPAIVSSDLTVSRVFLSLWKNVKEQFLAQRLSFFIWKEISCFWKVVLRGLLYRRMENNAVHSFRVNTKRLLPSSSHRAQYAIKKAKIRCVQFTQRGTELHFDIHGFPTEQFIGILFSQTIQFCILGPSTVLVWYGSQ